MGKQRWLLALILALAAGALTILVWPIVQNQQSPISLGLDLRGGSQLTLQVKTTDTITEITPDNLEAVKRVMENRVNGLGVSEAVVQSSGQDQLLIQLPGVSDPKQAERVLGGTAQLEFRKQSPDTETQFQIEQQVLQEHLIQQMLLQEEGDEAAIADNQADIETSRQAIADLFEPTELTGDKLRDALASPMGAGDRWEVAIEFDTEGANLFAEMTRDIAGTGRPIGIFLDNALISAPTVDVRYAETGIAGGRASISGRFDAESARDLEIQLRGGALPVPVEVVENRTVGATLGRDSIQRSLYAAIGGLTLVLIFMVAYYRLPGMIANLALLVYSLLTLSVFSLFGVTLTLPGIAGFILSIGMAVDANVLIFERTREELRSGKTLYRSVESGFYRAFSSILDSNVTTLIACAALFWLGAGLVKGFALTLAIGVAISMFTALTCSRTLLMFVLGFPQFRKPDLFCPGLSTSNNSQASSRS
ncbi:MAG: protein translocase subunit SecD [Leptolyngbyaceae cyanobacterium MO_188.B28]|nr:protein translocase subunit SecD [Leptolyngbyaceae cyanobacterium MO_188.B28]